VITWTLVVHNGNSIGSYVPLTFHVLSITPIMPSLYVCSSTTPGCGALVMQDYWYQCEATGSGHSPRKKPQKPLKPNWHCGASVQWYNDLAADTLDVTHYTRIG
jgi:hypothetical protein